MVRRAQLIGGRDDINVSIHPEAKKRLVKLAEERNRTVSCIAAEIIEEAMAVAS